MTRGVEDLEGVLIFGVKIEGVKGYSITISGRGFQGGGTKIRPTILGGN